jgi:hypothetical protein
VDTTTTLDQHSSALRQIHAVIQAAGPQAAAELTRLLREDRDRLIAAASRILQEPETPLKDLTDLALNDDGDTIDRSAFDRLRTGEYGGTR